MLKFTVNLGHMSNHNQQQARKSSSQSFQGWDRNIAWIASISAKKIFLDLLTATNMNDMDHALKCSVW